MRRATALLLMVITGYLITESARAQDLDSLLRNKRVYQAVDIGSLPPPRIDGLLEDTIWGLADRQGNFTQQQPVGGVPGTERTYVQVLYDRSNLYVSIICQDSDPERIRDIFDRRDAISGDMTGIAIDSYLDRRTAFEFNLSAAGQKMDLKHLGDYQWDFNWDGIWDGATSRCDSGWIAEMQIPFSQLRYADRAHHVWGMHVWRWIARKFEEDQWQYIPKEAPAMVYLFGNLEGVSNIRGSRQVEFLPYASLASERISGDGWQKLRPNAGIDAKVGISSDYTLDLSVNPDYGQVEADPSVLNLSAFEVFFEEKRPFFMEGNDIFDFELDGDIPYYSRRIGSAPSSPLGPGDHVQISDIPRNTTILGAAKLTGKSSRGLSIGIVNGLTSNEYAVSADMEGNRSDIMVAPLTNYMASRVKREFRQGQTIAGGMFTSVNRLGNDSLMSVRLPGSALTGGLDLLHYWDNKNYYVEAKTIASLLNGTPEAILDEQLSHIHRYQRPDAGYLEVDSLRNQLAGHGALIKAGKKGGVLNFNVMGQYRSPGMNFNDLGYIREADFFGSSADISYAMNQPGKWIRNYEISLSHNARWSFGKENTGNEAGINCDLMSNSHWRFNASYAFAFSYLDTRELRGGPALRTDGEHQAGLFVSSNIARDFSAYTGLHYSAFTYGGSDRKNIHAGVNWLPVRRVKLGTQATFDFIDHHQHYVNSVSADNGKEYLVGRIDRRTLSLTFRGEVFFTPELSLQYYGSPYYSVGSFGEFMRVDQGDARDQDRRLDPLDVTYDPPSNTYRFGFEGQEISFDNPDFSFMQFRSNLVLRWEYNLGSTLYVVWAHDRSGWENRFRPIGDIAGELFGTEGNHIIMVKLNFWFSV